MSSLKHQLKTHVRIVMVETSHPGNIGAAARAMKNMGHARLYLVNPKQFPNVQATARAAGADDVLQNAVVTDTVTEALQGCQLVFGCSARHRHLSWPIVTPKTCATHTLEHIQQGNEIGIIFGNEQSGLDNSLFKHCHFHLHIPSDTTYASLNLAAAVQVVVYEIYDTICRHKTTANAANKQAITTDDQLATGETLAAFFEHLEKVLWKIKFLNPAHPKRLMRRLQRLFNRAQLQTLEINILRGILSAVEHAQRGAITTKKENDTI